MEKIIEGFEIQSTYYCGYATISLVLSQFGHNFIRDILGMEWGFSFSKRYPRVLGADYEKVPNEYFITAELHHVNQIIADYFNIDMIWEAPTDSFEALMIKVKEYISKDMPLIFLADGKYLPYFDEYMKRHPESGHCVTVHGFDEEYIYFIDFSRAFVKGLYHKMDYKAFKQCIMPDDNVFQLKYEFLKFVKKGEMVSDERRLDHFLDSVRTSLQLDIKYENGWKKYLGVDGLNYLSEEAALFCLWGSDELIRKYLEDIFYMVVLVKQQRKGNLDFIISHEIFFSEWSIKEKAKEIFKIWNKLEITLSNIRKLELTEVAKRSSELIREVYVREKDLLEVIAQMER